ncbi:hypothetical protein [Photobacterium minamisatsumaniensis]|uniref:hypothetical protein n=1 Tax=Photobacterium minamisatsumaniensis TaxID=2910233 RepID=UPI003D11E1B3
MPHFIIDYSPNLEKHVSFDELFHSLHGFIEQSEFFPITGCRSRATAVNHFRVTNGNPLYAYIHVNFRVGSGRTQEQLKHAGDDICQLLEAWLEPINQTGAVICALSFEISQIDPVLTWKHNPIRQHMNK